MEKSKDFLKMLYFLGKLYYNKYVITIVYQEGEKKWEIKEREIIIVLKKQLEQTQEKLTKRQKDQTQQHWLEKKMLE